MLLKYHMHTCKHTHTRAQMYVYIFVCVFVSVRMCVYGAHGWRAQRRHAQRQRAYEWRVHGRRAHRRRSQDYIPLQAYETLVSVDNLILTCDLDFEDQRSRSWVTII